MSLIRRLFEDYKFARRFALFWGFGMASTALIWAIIHPEDMSQPMSAFLISVIGLVGTVTVFYINHRSKDSP